MFWPLMATAQDVEVDVELFLAVDVSRSMTFEELALQRRGYAQALSSPEVIGAIQSGLIGQIAVTYVEWAGASAQRVIVPWHLLASEEDADDISELILATDGSGLRRTSISGAINYATASFSDNGYFGLRRVIDISGDGPNNQGDPVTEARDRAIEAGFIINGLPLMTTDMLSEFWGIPDLDVYFETCVIGGPGAFVVPVLDWEAFEHAVRRKLILEISAVTAAARPIPVAAQEAYDCLIGEKMREQNRTYFVIP
ncbi:MAG: DUF1194 domain-containing protein [Pseudomonadota bacterium]